MGKMPNRVLSGFKDDIFMDPYMNLHYRPNFILDHPAYKSIRFDMFSFIEREEKRNPFSYFRNNLKIINMHKENINIQFFDELCKVRKSFYISDGIPHPDRIKKLFEIPIDIQRARNMKRLNIKLNKFKFISSQLYPKIQSSRQANNKRIYAIAFDPHSVDSMFKNWKLSYKKEKIKNE